MRYAISMYFCIGVLCKVGGSLKLIIYSGLERIYLNELAFSYFPSGICTGRNPLGCQQYCRITYVTLVLWGYVSTTFIRLATIRQHME